MSSKKPRRWAHGDGITATRLYNTRLTPAERQRAMSYSRQALQAMRAASATHMHYVSMLTTLHVAQAIEDGGIYRGQQAILSDANAALDSVGQRWEVAPGVWRPGACTGPELTALADLVATHARQIAELTYGEYIRAADKAKARVASGRGVILRAEGKTA